MTLTIETVYDPHGRCWHAEGYALSAKTLREMKALLPEGSVIVGYYPEGYGNIVKPRVVVRERPWEYENKYSAVREVDAEAFTGRTPSEAPAESAPPKPARTRFTARLTSSETAAVLEEELKPDLFRPEPVKDLGVASMPAKLQPTRPVHGKGNPTMAPVDWADAEPKMIRMLEEGLSVREVAAKIGTTRSAVIGRCQRRKIPLPTARRQK